MAQPVTIHRRRTDLYSGSHRAAAWVDYSFEELPTAAADGIGPGGCRRVESSMPPVDVQPPPLARLVEREAQRVDRGRIAFGPTLRLAVEPQTKGGWCSEWGLDPETVYRLSAHGERGFSMARRHDDGPTLFGPPEPPASASAYPRPAARPAPPPALPPPPPPPREYRDRAELLAIARQVVGEQHAALVARLNALEAGIGRALDQLRAAEEHDEPARIATARAVLEAALDWSPAETAQARSA